MCGSLFFALLSNFAVYFLLSIMLHCTTKRPVWAIHCLHSPKILKDGQKTEDFSLHFVRLSLQRMDQFSVSGNDFENDD